MKRSPFIAFLLALIPGFGHMYLGKRFRGFLYSAGFFGALFVTILITVVTGSDAGLVMAVIALFIWGINMLDIIFTLFKNVNTNATNETSSSSIADNDRFFTIVLSFIPGVGHFHLGLNQRGLTFLAGFIGIGIMIVFVTIVTNMGGFLLFLLALPIIWIYGLFDVIQLLNQKENGVELVDRTIIEDIDKHRESGKKSKVIATILGIFPGAGHMYLGLQRRGLQLMAGFLLSIYILDILHLSIFLFLIPIIWFYSFFDVMQQANRLDEEELEDLPVIKYFINHQRWIGIALILLGVFYMVDEIFIPVLAEQLREILQVNIQYYYQRYFQMTIVCLLFIGGGIKLLMGTKEKKGDYKA